MLKKSTKQLDSEIEHIFHEARASKLTWHHETIDLISLAAKDYFSETKLTWRIDVQRGSPDQVCVSIITNCLFPPKANQNLVIDNRFEGEEPATLTYTLHVDGSVAVLLSPHKSIHKNFRKTSYILTVYPGARSLAGSAGYNQIKRSCGLLHNLSQFSLTLNPPSPQAEKFFEGLESQSQAYELLYENKNEADRNRLNQQMGLGIGVAGGLVASTIFPLFATMGADARTRTKEQMNACEKKESKSLQSQCLHDVAVSDDAKLGDILAVHHVIIVASMITLILLVIMRSYLKRN